VPSEVAISGVRIGQLLVFVWLHTKNDPSDEEWDRAFDSMTAARRREGVPLTDVRSLVITDGGAPGGVQRARIGRELPIKLSVITTVLENPIKLGIATALSWGNPRFFFGGPKDAMRAAEHVDLADQWDVLWPVFVEMQRTLPRIQTLELLAEVLRRDVE
jgi:hypothetical protein